MELVGVEWSRVGWSGVEFGGVGWSGCDGPLAQTLHALVQRHLHQAVRTDAWDRRPGRCLRCAHHFLELRCGGILMKLMRACNRMNERMKAHRKTYVRTYVRTSVCM